MPCSYDPISTLYLQADSVLRFARGMITLRKARSKLAKDSIAMLDAPAGVLTFAHSDEGDRLVCLFNMDNAPKRVPGVGATDIVLGQHARLDGYAVKLGVCGFCLLQG